MALCYLQVCLEEQQSWCVMDYSLPQTFQFPLLVRCAELFNSKTWRDYSTVSNALGAVEGPKTPWQPDRDVQDWAPGTEDPILQSVSKIT